MFRKAAQRKPKCFGQLQKGAKKQKKPNAAGALAVVAQFASAAPIVLPQSRKRKPPPLALPISPLPLPRALPPSSTPSSSHASSPSLSSISSHASSSPSFPSPPRFIDNLLPRAPPLLHSPFSPNTVSKIRRLSQDHLLLLAGHAVQAPVVLHPAPCLLCIDCPSPQCPGESNRLAKAAQIAAHAKPPSTLRRKTVIAILPTPRSPPAYHKSSNIIGGRSVQMRSTTVPLQGQLPDEGQGQ